VFITNSDSWIREESIYASTIEITQIFLKKKKKKKKKKKNIEREREENGKNYLYQDLDG